MLIQTLKKNNTNNSIRYHIRYTIIQSETRKQNGNILQRPQGHEALDSRYRQNHTLDRLILQFLASVCTELNIIIF